MVSNAEVVIALGMPDTVHDRSHVNGNCTSKNQEVIGKVGDSSSLFSDWKISDAGGVRVSMRIRT